MAQVNVDTVIAAYVKLRDKRAALRKEYMTADEDLIAKMDKLEMFLLEKMKADNMTQLGSEHGTAYQQTVMKGNCSDWPSLWDFLAQSGRFDMLEKRISIKAVQEYYEQTGELPPGVNVNPELKVVIRRA
jgi:hypothetical protein